MPNEFRDRKVNIFMKNNYAFGGNNCCMILSMEPASIPVSTYDSKRVAISGVGAVSAIGHTLNRVLENIWAQDHHVELGSVTFPDDTLEEAKELLAVLDESNQFAELFDEEYSFSDATLPETASNFKTFGFPGWSRVNTCVVSISVKQPVAARLP